MSFFSDIHFVRSSGEKSSLPHSGPGPFREQTAFQPQFFKTEKYS